MPTKTDSFKRNSPPDATTIGRVLKKVNRDELETVFRNWVSTKLSGKKSVQVSMERPLKMCAMKMVMPSTW